jgi:hypothetical protein
MALAKTLEQFSMNVKRISQYCAYQFLYNSLSKEDQKALDDAWAKDMPVSIVVKALRQEGHKTSMDSVRAHRKGECKCPKK